jgi:hypothetical protein
MGGSRSVDVGWADEFLAEDKSLVGPPPEFGPKKNKSTSRSMWDAVWPIANSAGVVETGHLRVNYAPASEKPFSICLIFRDQCLFRLDFVASTVCHKNPQWAAGYDLPPTVCGPHFHPWNANREEVLRQQGWELPLRAPLPPRIRRFDQALPWMAAEIKLLLSSEQREFELPKELF